MFAERQDGALTLRRGFVIAENDRVLVVEDVLTTGGSTRETMQVARAAGRPGGRRRVDRQSLRRHGAQFDVPFASLLDDRSADLRARQVSALRAGAAGGETGVGQLPANGSGSKARTRRTQRSACAMITAMPTFKITLAYDGTDFVGWQRQAAGVSIQGLLEDALRELDGRDVAVAGAGRTDAGVHALGQVAAFAIERALAADAVVRALNARLPDAVRVLSRGRSAGLVPRALRRARRKPTATASGTAMSSARSSAATRGTCRARWTSTRCATAARLARRPARFRRVSGRRQRRRAPPSAEILSSDIESRDPRSADPPLRHLRDLRRPAFCGTWCARSPARWSRSDAAAGRPTWMAEVLASRDRAAGRPDGARRRACFSSRVDVLG